MERTRENTKLKKKSTFLMFPLPWLLKLSLSWLGSEGLWIPVPQSPQVILKVLWVCLLLSLSSLLLQFLAKPLIYISVISQSMWMKVFHKHAENVLDNSNFKGGGLSYTGKPALRKQLQTIVTLLSLPSESGHFRPAHHIVSFLGYLVICYNKN